MNHPLFTLLSELDTAGIHFTLGRYRPDSVLVTLTLIGERVEVYTFADGHMEVSRFKGDESVLGDEALVAQLIEENRE